MNAAVTFYVDSDLNLSENAEIELNIFSSTFSVQHDATFYLNGKHGEFQSPPNSDGFPGRPGNVGLNAGNFFALTNNLVNGDLLTVVTAAMDRVEAVVKIFM